MNTSITKRLILLIVIYLAIYIVSLVILGSLHSTALGAIFFPLLLIAFVAQAVLTIVQKQKEG